MAKICLQCRYFYHGHGNKPSLCTNRHSEKFPDKLRHNGHSPICRHFRPPKHNHVSKVSGMFSGLGKLRFIESLRGIYAGREIWIFATGPSLDDIPDGFLQVDERMESDPPVPKVCIAVKEAAIAFPNCTFNMFAFRDYGLRHSYLPRGMIPRNFKKFIFSIRKVDTENYFGKQAAQATYMRYSKGGTLGMMKNVCDSIVAGSSSSYCGVYTIMHLAIEAAVVMGASRISLVGCDHEAIGGKLRAQKRGISRGYAWNRPEPPGAPGYAFMKVGTDFLASYFRKHGIEIARYYYGRGYELIGESKGRDEVDEVM